MKLFHMMEHLETVGFSHIAGFQPHGRAIRIHDPRRFQNDILPRYFPDNKNVGSFLRQLNIYGFRRMINNGPDRDSYYHAMFLRGRPDLCSIIERPSRSEHSKRQKYDPTTEPIFYTMPPIQILPECHDIKHNSSHGERPVNVAESNESGRRNKRQRNLSQTSWEDDVKKAPAFNYPTATSSPFNHGDNSSTLSNYNKALDRTAAYDIESPLQSTSSLRHENQFLSNNNCSIRFGMSSDGVINDTEVSSDIADAPIASYLYSGTSTLPVFNTAQPTTNYQHPNNSTVPANVVAAAASLLATQYDPILSIDSSSSIIDQYCLNLATNIMKESCYPVSTTTNTQQDVPVGFSQSNDRQMTHPPQAHESTDTILPLSLKRPAIETTTNRNVDGLGKNEISGPQDSDGSSGSSGSGIARFLDHANLDCNDSN
jgi:HSF-type DNA-binding